VVDTAADGEAGLYLALEHPYDLIVLDVMLPIFSGWMLIEKLRARGVATPVLFLTARDSVDDRVKGLEMGGTIIW